MTWVTVAGWMALAAIAAATAWEAWRRHRAAAGPRGLGRVKDDTVRRLEREREAAEKQWRRPR